MVFNELDKWEKNHVNIEKITVHADEIERENQTLVEKMKLLEKRVQVCIIEINFGDKFVESFFVDFTGGKRDTNVVGAMFERSVFRITNRSDS